MGVEKHPAKIGEPPENIISQLSEDKLPMQEVVYLLKDESILIRANACLSITRQAKGHEELIENLVSVAEDPLNSTLMFGKRVSDLAVAALLSIATPKADNAALKIVGNWSLDDRYDILSWSNRLELMSQYDIASYNENQHQIRLKIYSKGR